MSDQWQIVTADLELPSQAEMASELEELVAECDAARRCLDAVVGGRFNHPDGRSEPLFDIRLPRAQLALVAHLAKKCPARISVDIGFGMGTSATMIMAARRSVGARFNHIAFDPWGLPDKRGTLVQEFLDVEFAEQFERRWKVSELGMPQLIEERGQGSAGLVFIDGFHTFEQVMVDFVMSDLLVGVGGYIIFDDACFPAIEAVIDYIRRNRPDYAVSHLPVVNTSIAQKISAKRPDWDAYRPFPIPTRIGWTSSDPNWSVDQSVRTVNA